MNKSTLLHITVFYNKVLCVLSSGPVVPPQRAVLLVQGERPGQDAPIP